LGVALSWRLQACREQSDPVEVSVVEVSGGGVAGSGFVASAGPVRGFAGPRVVLDRSFTQ
jgi:hypothetical protein